MPVKELDSVRKKIKKDFKVVIFGSARIKKGDEVYKKVYDLSKEIGKKGYDIITGGGPGLMEAANAGHTAGDVLQRAESIGLNIKLPFEQSVNEFVEFKKEFARFAERIETFDSMAHVFVITPGGVGTMLEFFYTWQLLQVRMMKYKPIILIGEMWKRLIYWVIDYAIKDSLVASQDFDYIYIAENNKEALKLIDTFNEQYKQKGKCWPIGK